MRGQAPSKLRRPKSARVMKGAQSNEPVLPSGMPAAPPGDWFKPWWRECSLFALDPASDDYLASPHPGLEPLFDWFWESNRIPAWAYELVRRLVNTEGATLSEKEEIHKMPPYPQLDPSCRQAIKVSVGEIYGWGPVLLNQAGVDLRPFKYSEPIPPWSFDLQGDEDTQLEVIRDWLDQQIKAAGISRSLGKKGGKSRNKKATGRLGDWRFVEVLGKPFERKTARSRRTAIRHAKKFKERILGTWLCCREDPSFLCPAPPAAEIPGFTGRQFTQAQFMAILEAATKQFPMNHNPPA